MIGPKTLGQVSYLHYCYDCGEKPLTEVTFGKRMKQHGHRSEPHWDIAEGRTRRFYMGIRLKDDSDRRSEEEAQRKQLDLNFALADKPMVH